MRVALCLLALLLAAPASAGRQDPKPAESGATDAAKAKRRQQALKAARGAKILGVLKAQQGGSNVASIFGSSSFSSNTHLVRVSGGLSRKEADGALDRQRTRLEACVTKETLKLALRVTAGGKVLSVTPLNSVVKDPKAAACVRQAFKRYVRFPRKARASRLRVTIHSPVHALGGLIGAPLGKGYGAGGLGLRGSGRGGGGTGQGTLGVGGLGTIGRGSGSGSGYGRGAGPMRRRPKSIVRAGRPVVGSGALDQNIIRRVIRRHLNEVRYCHAVRLAHKPSLQGRVVMRFVIGAAGSVQSARVSSDTTGDAKLGSCIVRHIMRWLFPRPKGGGKVIVSYPFSFKTIN